MLLEICRPVECFCSVIYRTLPDSPQGHLHSLLLSAHHIPLKRSSISAPPPKGCVQLLAPGAEGFQTHFLRPECVFWGFRKEVGPGALTLLPEKEGRIRFWWQKVIHYSPKGAVLGTEASVLEGSVSKWDLTSLSLIALSPACP